MLVAATNFILLDDQSWNKTELECCLRGTGEVEVFKKVYTLPYLAIPCHPCGGAGSYQGSCETDLRGDMLPETPRNYASRIFKIFWLHAIRLLEHGKIWQAIKDVGYNTSSTAQGGGGSFRIGHV